MVLPHLGFDASEPSVVHQGEASHLNFCSDFGTVVPSAGISSVSRDVFVGSHVGLHSRATSSSFLQGADITKSSFTETLHKVGGNVWKGCFDCTAAPRRGQLENDLRQFLWTPASSHATGRSFFRAHGTEMQAARTSFNSSDDKADEAKSQAELVKKLAEKAVQLAERARDITMVAVACVGGTAVFEFFDVMYTQREVNRKLRQIDDDEEAWREKLGAHIEQGVPSASGAGLQDEGEEEEVDSQEEQPAPARQPEQMAPAAG